jgi:DNA helicase II / ATP-dependent DNA helicase PcrA
MPKIKTTLVIAGAGAGKTYQLIETIKSKLPLLSPHQYLAVITYTNAASQEIQERLSKETPIPPNVFIGTIHSFLIRFILKPFGSIYGVIPRDVIYKSVKIISKKSGQEKVMEENAIKKKLIKKGIVPYEQIVTQTKLLLDNKEIRKLVTQRLQYLFVDEFQDADSGQFNIFEIIRKENHTEMFFVGDPEQSIMTFQRKGSKVSSFDKRPIIVTKDKKTTSTQILLNNHRSTTPIVQFLNHFHTSIQQIKSNLEIDAVYAVVFIDDSNFKNIITNFNELCNDKIYCLNKPKKRFFLGYENKLYKPVAEEFGLFPKQTEVSNPVYALEKTSNFICGIYNNTKHGIMKNLEIDIIVYREKCLNIIQFVRDNPALEKDELVTYLNTLFPLKVDNHRQVQFQTDKELTDLINVLNHGFSSTLNKTESDDFYLTIHKSKGLQADAVLATASNTKELMAWLETDKQIRWNDKLDKCRLGYVAFSRAREFLCIACLEPIDDLIKDHVESLGVQIVQMNKELLSV